MDGVVHIMREAEIQMRRCLLANEYTMGMSVHAAGGLGNHPEVFWRGLRESMLLKKAAK